MGCDGGTIPRRDELVRLKKKPEQKDKDSERLYRWRHCALTQQKLQQPIVMCGLGRLYSKQSVIEAILEKEKMPETCAHIKGLKDIKDLNLTPNPAFNDDETKSAPFICALIGLEMSGQFRFIALWQCGCVFSERALKELKTNICPTCQKPFTEEDIIILNGSEEDTDLMRTKMEARHARLKAEKKDKKKNKKEVAETTVTSSSNPTAVPNTEETKPSRTIDEPGSSKTSISKLPIVANPVINKATKRAMISGTLNDPLFKKSKDDYKIQDDNKTTEVYKSLFTSHHTEQKQERAHWVTYNPHYN